MDEGVERWACGAAENLTGRMLGSYILVARLDADAAGVRYRARHRALDREATIRVLPTELSARPDLLAHVAAASALDHANLLAIYEIEEQDGLRYVITPPLAGETLGERLARGAVAPHEAVAYLQQLAAALDYAHERGVVHGGVTPDRVRLDGDGQAALTEVGIAAVLGGDPDFLPPEWAGGAADVDADRYALGVIARRLLGGHGALAALADLPAAVRAVLDRALAPDPGARYATAGALAEAFAQAWLAAPLAGEAEAAVAEAVFRHYLRGYKGPVAFLSLGQDAPPERFFQRLADLGVIGEAARPRRWWHLGRRPAPQPGLPRLLPADAAKVARDAVIEVGTGQRGVIFSVTSVRWVTAGEAAVEASFLAGGLAGRGANFRVVREGSRWKIDETAIRPTWIS